MYAYWDRFIFIVIITKTVLSDTKFLMLNVTKIQYLWGKITAILCRCSTGADPTTLGLATKVRGSRTKIHKKGQENTGSVAGWYTYRQDVVTTPTRRRVGDIYCTASRRRTTTSSKPLTQAKAGPDKPYRKTTGLEK